MAEDWIKMRVDLDRHPKVLSIADHLINPNSELARYVNQNMQRDMTVTRNVMRCVTVGALVTVWGVARKRGERFGDDLLLRGVTSSVIDDIADIPGFGDAMSSCGWIIETKKGVVFPRFFDEYNVDPRDNQSEKNRERQRRFRDKNRNVTCNVTVSQKSNVTNAQSKRERESNQSINQSKENQGYEKNTKSVLSMVQTKHLADTSALVAWHRYATDCRLAPAGDDGLILIFAAAACAEERGKKNPGGFFRRMFENQKFDVSAEHKRNAKARLEIHRSETQ